MELSSKLKLLAAARIPGDSYLKAMDLAEEFDFEPGEDPVADFKAAVILLNENAALPSWLNEWCSFYDLDHNEMDLEPMDEEIEI